MTRSPPTHVTHAMPATFIVRPCLDDCGRPLIEFRGDHRAAGYPDVLALLDATLPGFAASLEPPVVDDFVWRCRFDGGEFELTDEGAGLFILPLADAHRVMETVAAALAGTGTFRRA